MILHIAVCKQHFAGSAFFPRLSVLYTRCYHHGSSAHPPFKILFLGRDQFSCLVLNELHAARDVWDEISVATHPDQRTGRRGTLLSISPLKLLAQNLNIPVYAIPHTKSEFKTWKPPPQFSNLNPAPLNHVVVTASFGRILPASLLNMFTPTRRLNIHPSLLPAYRGPAPIQHAILSGDEETGVCVIEMLKLKQGIDSGAIWGCSRVPLHNGAMFVDLRDTLAETGGRLLVSVLRDMRAGKATCIPQPPIGSLSHAPMISAKDSIIDFATMSAQVISRRYRAISHQVCTVDRHVLSYLQEADLFPMQRPLTTCISTGKTVQLHSPAPLDMHVPFLSEFPGTAMYHKPSRSLIIRCADDSVLSIPLIKQESKTLMDAKDWWNGVKGLGLVRDGELQLVNGIRGSVP